MGFKNFSDTNKSSCHIYKLNLIFQIFKRDYKHVNLKIYFKCSLHLVFIIFNYS